MKKIWSGRYDKHGKKIYHGDKVKRTNLRGATVIDTIDINDWVTLLDSMNMEVVN